MHLPNCGGGAIGSRRGVVLGGALAHWIQKNPSPGKGLDATLPSALGGTASR